MPLCCLVAPLSQREPLKVGGGSGGGEWRGEEGARRPGPEGQFLHRVLRHALRNALRNVLRRVLDVLVLHVSPKGSVGAGTTMSTFKLPSFAAPSTSSATSCANSFTCSV